MKLLRYLKSLTFATILFPLVVIATIASSTHAYNLRDSAIPTVQSHQVINELKNLPLIEILPQVNRVYSPLPDPDFQPAFDLLPQRK